MKLALVYVLCKNSDEAKNLAHILLQEKLIACANLLGPISSVYMWEGKVREERECAMILKSSAVNFEAIVERVTKLHSYEIPCILQLPVRKGNAGFINWVSEQLAGD